ncbi:alpha N-terminal protein methyltransferase 1 [Scaptodrosophila lebanonensis]|uniref:Alpha N-terminal protein methyltransferase 1 n=1 Tax=Drosophila lebanonensis TaxID=7225 RepID=A0A6J2UGK5_DROLE|nr:alpha N-terminal protein methyltransferase 1 [Scaptodrosophila lebanonensis]
MTKDNKTIENELVSKLDTVNIANHLNIMNNCEANDAKGAVEMAACISNSPAVPASPSPFYGKAQEYWSQVPATVNGMLGGLGFISAVDIQGSNIFLRELKLAGNKLALDCGAGIGRVSRNLLIPRFDKVDLVEQDTAFAAKAREYCTIGCVHPNRLGEIYNVGLQEFQPPSDKKYDLIWSQWVLGHLTDEDLLAFFQRMRMSLASNAYLVMKENVTSTKNVMKDEEDSSVTRPLQLYERLLTQAGFRIVRKVKQQNFPKELFPVYMIACKPIAPK